MTITIWTRVPANCQLVIILKPKYRLKVGKSSSESETTQPLDNERQPTSLWLSEQHTQSLMLTPIKKLSKKGK